MFVIRIIILGQDSPWTVILMAVNYFTNVLGIFIMNSILFKLFRKMIISEMSKILFIDS